VFANFLGVDGAKTHYEACASLRRLGPPNQNDAHYTPPGEYGRKRLRRLEIGWLAARRPCGLAPAAYLRPCCLLALAPSASQDHGSCESTPDGTGMTGRHNLNRLPGVTSVVDSPYGPTAPLPPPPCPVNRSWLGTPV